MGTALDSPPGSGGELIELLGSLPGSEVLRRLSGASDSDLADLFAESATVRHALRVLATGLDGALAGMAEVQERWALGVEILPGLRSAVAEDAAESHAVAATLHFEGDRVQLSDRAESGIRAGLRTDAVTAVRLATGQLDAGLAHLGGRLGVLGDESAVLTIGRRLRGLVSGRPLIDPSALVPEAVAASIAAVDDSYLVRTMSGAFRPLVLEEVFRRIPEFLIPEKAARVRVSVAMAVTGRADGGEDRYVVRVADGACEVVPDPAGEVESEATLVLESAQFLRLVLGQLNPIRGVLSGRLRVRGELVKALALNSVLRIPGS